MIYNNHLPGRPRSDTNHLDDLAIVVDKTVKALRPRKRKFNCIVVRGMSGALVGSPVSIALKLPLCVVRKPNDDAHSSYRGLIGAPDTRPLFLDDFISSGATKEAAQAKIPFPFVATYEYDDDKWRELKIP